ncbi:unnamed protein product, partial [marine sediment metagenome]
TPEQAQKRAAVVIFVSSVLLDIPFAVKSQKPTTNATPAQRIM